MIGRLPILDLFPTNDLGPVKAVPGERFSVSATIIREGHDSLSAGVALYSPEGRRSSLVRMHEHHPGTDRFEAEISLPSEGQWSFAVESWHDPFLTWRHTAEINVPLGQDTELVLEEGARLLARAGRRVPRDPALKHAARALRDTGRSPRERLAAGLDGDVVAAVDLGDSSGPVAAGAAEYAALTGRALTLVAAVPITVGARFPYPGQGALEVRAMHEYRAEHLTWMTDTIREEHPDLDVHWRLFDGPPAGVLSEATRTAALVVLGTRGHGGFTGLLLGSVSQSVLSRTVSPVLVIPTPGS